jgi:hypothetical protein
MEVCGEAKGCEEACGHQQIHVLSCLPHNIDASGLVVQQPLTTTTTNQYHSKSRFG